MRVPYSIIDTDYAYLAMKAMLSAVANHNLAIMNNTSKEQVIKSVACCGLGTFFGKLDANEAARQMSAAFKNFLQPPSSITWGFASERQQQVIFGGNPQNAQKYLMLKK